MKLRISIFAVVFFLIAADAPPVPGDGRHPDPEENALNNQGVNHQVHLLNDYPSASLR